MLQITWHRCALGSSLTNCPFIPFHLQQRATQLLIPELKTKVRFSFSTAPWPKEAAKRMPHTTIVLKANMFFHFQDEKVTRRSCMFPILSRGYFVN
jgi:hypothetical protein